MSERTNKRTRVKKWWLDHVWHRLVLPLGEPEFFTETEVKLARRLYVADPTAAEALLAQAKEMDNRVYKTAESIETRAMTLQGAVAIATTLALAAAGLLLDRAKIPSHGWRIAFAIALALTVGAFIASGLRALGASSKTYAWTFPGHHDIFDHAKMGLTGAHAARAAAHLKSAGLNERIVSVKGGYLNAAVSWFRVALALLLASAVLLLVYSVVSDPHAVKNRQPSKPVPVRPRHVVGKCRPSLHPGKATTRSQPTSSRCAGHPARSRSPRSHKQRSTTTAQ